MDLTVRGLALLVHDSLVTPRQAAARVIALGAPLGVGLQALALVAVGSALMTHLALLAQPLPPDEPLARLFSSPLRTAAVQLVAMLAAAWFLHRFGRWRGGTGTLPQTVAVLAWLQFVMLVLQGLQLVADVLLPPLSGLLAVAGIAAFFWLLTAFTMELHGFRRPLPTFFGVLFGLMLLGLVLAIVLGGLVGQGAG